MKHSKLPKPDKCTLPRRGAQLVVALLLFANSLPFINAQTATSQTPEIHEHLLKAGEYLKTNDPNSAVKEFNAVLALDPRNAEAYANLGVIAFFRHDYQNAVEYLRSAVAIDPSLTKTQALLGLCERRLGQSSAQALLEKSFSALKDKRLQIQVGMELAGIYDEQGDLDRTAAVMRSLVDLDPENVDILFMAQRVYFDLAGDTLNKLAILAPASARMQQVVARRLINNGDLKGAIEHYRKALEINPRLPGVHYELGEAILESSPNDAEAQGEAGKELDTAVKLDGDSAGTECVFARLASKRSDLDGAYAHYNRAFALNPREVEAQVGLGRLLTTMGKPQEALKYLRMAVQSDPLNSEAHYRLASVYKKLGMADDAQKELGLFQTIRRTKKQVADLYRMMNMRPQATNEEDADIPQ